MASHLVTIDPLGDVFIALPTSPVTEPNLTALEEIVETESASLLSDVEIRNESDNPTDQVQGGAFDEGYHCIHLTSSMLRPQLIGSRSTRCNLRRNRATICYLPESFTEASNNGIRSCQEDVSNELRRVGASCRRLLLLEIRANIRSNGI